MPEIPLLAADVLDARFASTVAHQPGLERLCTGCRWSEGPLWMHEDQSVLWSDILNNRIMRWSEKDGMSVWQVDVEFTNGRSRDLDGSILHCSHGQRAILRGLPGKTGEIVVDRYEGRRFNSPNDIVVKADGTIWFTDPPYGLIMPGEGYPAEPELDGCKVFRYDAAQRELSVVTSVPIHPNGLAFSPDEKVLYVSDSSAVVLADGNRCVFAFDVRDERYLDNGRRFAEIEPGVPDGMRVDHRGFLYVGTYDSVQVFAPDGDRIGRIPVPEKVANLTFGGPNRNELFICATTSLYRIKLRTRGAQLP